MGGESYDLFFYKALWSLLFHHYSTTPVGLITDSVIQRYNIIITPPNHLTLINIFIIMTTQEIENNYTYKVIRKVLMREYPWIKDVRLDTSRMGNFKYVIFLDLFIDPYELGKEHDWTVARWIETSIRNNEPYDSTMLSLFFVGSTDDMREQKEHVNKTISDVQESPAIPPEMRLPTSEVRLLIGSFFTADNITIPEPEPEEDIEEEIGDYPF
jgi:hypothetical protein